MSTSTRRINYSDAFGFAFHLIIVTSTSNVDQIELNEGEDLKHYLYKGYIRGKTVAARPNGTSMTELYKHAFLGGPREIDCYPRPIRYARALGRAALCLFKISVELLPRCFEHWSGTLYTDARELFKEPPQFKDMSNNPLYSKTIANMASKVASGILLAAVSCVAAPFKILSLTIRSWLSHQEVWAGASRLDKRLFENTTLMGVGPIEIVARAYSTALLFGSLFTPAAVATGISAIPIIGSLIAKTVVAPIINNGSAPVINFIRKATPGLSPLWSAVTETAAIVSTHYIKKPLGRLANYLFPEKGKKTTSIDQESSISSFENGHHDTEVSQESSRNNSLSSSTSSILSGLTADEDTLNSSVEIFAGAINAIVGDGSLLQSGNSITLDNLLEQDNQKDLTNALNGIITSNQSQGVITQLNKFIMRVTNQTTLSIMVDHAQEIRSAIANFYLKDKDIDKNPTLYDEVSNYYQNRLTATALSSQANSYGAWNARTKSVISDVSGFTPRPSLDDYHPHDLNRYSDESRTHSEDSEASAQASNPTKGHGIFDRMRSVFSGDKNAKKVEPKS
jgi:hypothetical protein